MAVITICQATFSNVSDLTPSVAPPVDPLDGQVWQDTSVVPPIIRRWDAAKKKWVNATNSVYFQASTPSSLYAIANDIWFDTDDGNKIYTYDGTNWVVKQLGNSALAANSVTANQIAASAVITAKIAANAITAEKIAVNAITAEKILAGAISTDKLAANAVTAAKIAAGTITATQLAASTITTDKIAAGAITATQIAVNAITTDKIVADAITTAKIATGAVTANEIAAGTITAAKIAAGAITATQLAAGAVTAAKIAAGTITATQIAANAITAGKIASKAVTADKISVTDLYAIGAKIGGMTIANDKVYGEITSGSTVWGSGIAPYKANQYSLWVGETNQQKGGATTNAPFKVSQNGTVWTEKLYAGNSMDLYDSTATWKGELFNIFREDGTLKIKQNHHTNGKTILMLDQSGGEAQLVFNYAGSPHGTVYFYSGYNSSTYVGMYHKERNNGAGGAIWRYHVDGKFHIDASTVANAIQCTTLTQTSTIRAKRDWKVVKPGSALKAIKNTQIYTYRLNGFEDLGEQMGLIIEKNCPKEVITPDGSAVNLYSFISLVANAVRELAAQVDEQSSSVDMLVKNLGNILKERSSTCTK